MMGTKHTPGPWAVEPISPMDTVMLEEGTPLAKDDNYCITAEQGNLPMVVYQMPGKHVPEGEANACLVAAAPELLAACVALVQAFTRLPYSHEERHHALTIAYTAMEKAGKQCL